MKFLSNYSNRELNIWGEIGLDILVSLYFFPRVIYLIKLDEVVELVPLISLIVSVIVIAVVYSIIVFGAIAWLTKEEEKDERDWGYELKGYRIGYFLVQAGVLIFIGIIVYNPNNNARLGDLSLPIIAVALYAILVIGSLGKSLTLLYNYRRAV